MPVRAASTDDLSDLQPLFNAYLDFYQVSKTPQQVRDFLGERLRRGDSYLLIARNERGASQGFVQLYPLLDSLELRPCWLLNDLYVAPAYRRYGVGEALLEAARAHAQATGACALQLDTAKSNAAAQSLYERLGYVRDVAFYTYRLDLL